MNVSSLSISLAFAGIIIKKISATHLIRNSKVLYCIASYVAFRHPPKSISILHCQFQWKSMNKHFHLSQITRDRQKQNYFRRANDFSEMDVHPCIAINQMAVISLSIFQFHQLLHSHNININIIKIIEIKPKHNNHYNEESLGIKKNGT